MREGGLPYFIMLLLPRGCQCFANLPRGSSGSSEASEACYCSISWSYSLPFVFAVRSFHLGGKVFQQFGI